MSYHIGICISNRRKEVRQAENDICLPSAGKLLDVKHTEAIFCTRPFLCSEIALYIQSQTKRVGKSTLHCQE